MGSFRDALKKVLTLKEQSLAIASFDTLGSMALIEIPDALQSKKTKIARTLLDTHSSLDRVFEKVGTHTGKYRVEKIHWLAGEKDPVVTHKEWGCVYRVHPGDVFFSQRLSTERQRVTSAIKKGQSVLVAFAGVGPFAIAIAKHAQPARVLALEWNPKAIPYLKENIALNKVEKMVEAHKADFSSWKPQPQFDHVVLPAPHSAIDHLSTAASALQPSGGLIHCYLFVPNRDPTRLAKETIQAKLKQEGILGTVIESRKVLPFSAALMQCCVIIRIRPRAKQTSIRKKRAR